MNLSSAHKPTGAEIEYDLRAPDLYLDPHPLLHRLRAEDPVHYSPQLESWVLTTYADCNNALQDPRLSVVEETKRIDALPEAVQEKLLPLRRSFQMWGGRSQVHEHELFQKLLRRSFTPAMAERLRSGVQSIADELCDDALRRGDVDVVNDIAHPMAMRVVTQLVLDIPYEGPARLATFLRLSADISGLLEMGEEEQLFRCQAAILELTDYFSSVVRAHRREGRGGVIGAMIAAEDEGLITHEQTCSNCIMFLVVGYHTTANLLGNGLQLLFEHPEEREKLTRDFGLLPTAIDEMMRFHGPVASVRRLCVDDHEIRGRKIGAGQTILLALTAANRDPAVYRNPDRFDITREDNRHLGFTVGPYSCMGKALARIEGETFLKTMLSRLPRLRPRDENPDWMVFRPLGHELRTLRVLFD